MFERKLNTKYVSKYIFRHKPSVPTKLLRTSNRTTNLTWLVRNSIKITNLSLAKTFSAPKRAAVSAYRSSRLKNLFEPLLTYAIKGLSDYFGPDSYPPNPESLLDAKALLSHETRFSSGKTPIVGLIIPKSYLTFNRPNIYTLFKFFSNPETEQVSRRSLSLDNFYIKFVALGRAQLSKVSWPSTSRKTRTRTSRTLNKSQSPKIGRSSLSSKTAPRTFAKAKSTKTRSVKTRSSSLLRKESTRVYAISLLGALAPKTRSFVDLVTPQINPPGIIVGCLLPSLVRLFLKRRLYSYGGFFVDPDLLQPYIFTNNRLVHSKYTRRSFFRGFLKHSATRTRARKIVKSRRLRFFKRKHTAKPLQRSKKFSRFRTLTLQNVFLPSLKWPQKTKTWAGRLSHLVTPVDAYRFRFSPKILLPKIQDLGTSPSSLLRLDYGTDCGSHLSLKKSSPLHINAQLMSSFRAPKEDKKGHKLTTTPKTFCFILGKYGAYLRNQSVTFWKNYKLRPLRVSRHKPPFIKPQSLKHYILISAGFFLVGKVFKPLIKFTPRFNKKIYSFLFPNEVKNKLLRKKKKIKYQSAVFKLRNKLKYNKFFSYKEINKNYRNFLLTQSDLKVTKLSYGFSNLIRGSVSEAKIGYRNSQDDVADEEYFYNKGLSISFKRMEVHIPRIRFRPGYQRIWRQARSAIKESLGLRFVYQRQLTKYMMRFSRESRLYFLGENVARVDRVIIYSHLLPDMPAIDTFREQSMIYINGRLLKNLHGLVYKDDFIQLAVSVWFYVANRWLDNWTIRRLKRFRRLVFRKNRAHKYTVIKTRKQKSRYTPDWIFDHKFDNLGIRQYLEVDFFTLSAFVVYDPRLNFYSSPDEVLNSRTNIYRMYNWKYIT